MTRVKKLALATLAALALAAGAAAYVPAQQYAGDPSQWGIAKKGSFDLSYGEQLAKKGSFDITELNAA